MADQTFTKQLLDALKNEKLKAKKLDAPNGKTSRITIDDVTLARIVPGKTTEKKPNGALRVYVFVEKLPAKLAKSFSETAGMGYSINVTSDDELKLAVEALVIASSALAEPPAEPPASESPKRSTTKRSTTKPASESKKRASTKRASTKPADDVTPERPSEAAMRESDEAAA